MESFYAILFIVVTVFGMAAIAIFFSRTFRGVNSNNDTIGDANSYPLNHVATQDGDANG